MKHTDDAAFTPSLVTRLERGSHGVDVADTLEGVVQASVGELDQHLLNGLLVVLGVDAVGGTELLGCGRFVGHSWHVRGICMS